MSEALVNGRTSSMRRLLSYAALSLSLLAGAAHADMSKMYVGGGLSDANVEDAFGAETTLGTLSATIGYNLHPFFALELQLGTASDDTQSIVSESLLTYAAAMVRVGYQWDRVGIYLLGGQAQLNFDSRISDIESGSAVGIGINLFGTRNTSLNLHVLNFDGGLFRTTTIGLQHYFGGYR